MQQGSAHYVTVYQLIKDQKIRRNEKEKSKTNSDQYT